ncbi:conserved hypothetical protein [Klebsiella pneumoniae]|nr:conserved hypothetical protein [Klebsiella pneumoniae]
MSHFSIIETGAFGLVVSAELIVVTPVNEAQSSMAGIAAVSFLVKTVIKIPLNKRDQCKSPVDNAALLYCRALSVASSNGSY